MRDQAFTWSKDVVTSDDSTERGNSKSKLVEFSWARVGEYLGRGGR